MKALKKVLVVDDDAVVGRSFDRVLSEKGYDVSTALDGEEALNKCRGDEYDVVFTDIKMPGMDGLEVAKRIKAKAPWTPVVIITGYGTDENEAQAKVLGVNGFVRKPLTPEMIEGITLKAVQEKEGVEVAYQTAEPEAEAAVVAAPAAEELVTGLPEVTEMESRIKKTALFLKNVALLIAAPFLGLAYAIAFPFIGLGMAVRFGVRAMARRHVLQNGAKVGARFAKQTGLLLLAPFMALVYAVTFPFVGLAMLAWFAIRALGYRPKTG